MTPNPISTIAAAMLLCVLTFGGCALLNHPTANSGTATAVNSVVADINTSVKELKTQQDALVTSVNALSTHFSDTNQFVSDRLAESLYANTNNPQPNGTTLLIASNLTEAATAIGVPPSTAVKDREIEDLKLALSTSAADAKTLATRNQDLLNQATALQGQTTLLTSQVTAKETALIAATATVDSKTNALSQANDQVKIKAAEAETARAEAAKEAAQKARLATARWFMLAGGALIALGIVGLFFHIPDAWIASVAGAALLGTGWLISYVEDLLQQPWFRYGMDGLVVFGIGAGVWFAFRAFQHKTAINTTQSAFEGLVGAVQSAASKDTALEAQLQPVLQEWLVTDKGIPDTAVVTAINAMAAKLNLTNPGQPSAASGTTSAKTSAIPATPVATTSTQPTVTTVTSVSSATTSTSANQPAQTPATH